MLRSRGGRGCDFSTGRSVGLAGGAIDLIAEDLRGATEAKGIVSQMARKNGRSDPLLSCPFVDSAVHSPVYS